MIKIEHLSVDYGSVHALSDVSMEIRDGEVTALIGANGAGKTTLLKTISGIVSPVSGSIEMDGEQITGLSPKKIVEKGIAHVPEGRQLFPEMTVEENLMMGAFIRTDKEGVAQSLNDVYELFPKLLDRKNQLAGTLSGGEQQMVAMARALMLNPKILLLDEPSMGLAPIIVEDIFNTIIHVQEQGKTILLIEQNAQAALNIAKSAYVLENGRISLHGTGLELENDERVKEAYLGL